MPLSDQLYKEDAVPGRLRNPCSGPVRRPFLRVGGAASHLSGLALYGSVPRLEQNIRAGTSYRKTPGGNDPALSGENVTVPEDDGCRRADLTTLRSSEPHKEEIVVPLTQTQLAAAVADRAEITKAEAKRILDALEDVVLDEIANAEKVKIGGLVQLTVRVKPASKARQGRNPATGEEITIAAKPASVDVRARALTKAKAALPSVQKARRRLG